MRRREGLVQVHVDDIEAHVTRPHLAENRVEVGAVVIQQAAGRVHDACHFLDTPLEHAEGRRVGQHDAGRLRADHRAQCFDIDVAIFTDGDLPYDTAAHRRGRRIGAVSRFRHDDLVAREIAACTVIGADHRDTRELALRAGHRRERHALHAGHFLEHFLQLEHAGQKALAARLRRQRMAREELRAASRTGYTPSGCTSSCTNPADRSACRWRSSAATSRVKWRTVSSSLTSGNSGGCLRLRSLGCRWRRATAPATDPSRPDRHVSTRI